MWEKVDFRVKNYLPCEAICIFYFLNMSWRYSTAFLHCLITACFCVLFDLKMFLLLRLKRDVLQQTGTLTQTSGWYLCLFCDLSKLSIFGPQFLIFIKETTEFILEVWRLSKLGSEKFLAHSLMCWFWFWIRSFESIYWIFGPS